MRFEQNDEFKPITITLETRQEAEALWDAVRNTQLGDSTKDAILRSISNWFSSHAHL